MITFSGNEIGKEFQQTTDTKSTSPNRLMTSHPVLHTAGDLNHFWSDLMATKIHNNLQTVRYGLTAYQIFSGNWGQSIKW